jgi:hypothetical protein
VFGCFHALGVPKVRRQFLSNSAPILAKSLALVSCATHSAVPEQWCAVLRREPNKLILSPNHGRNNLCSFFKKYTLLSPVYTEPSTIDEITHHSVQHPISHQNLQNGIYCLLCLLVFSYLENIVIRGLIPPNLLDAAPYMAGHLDAITHT